MASSSSYWILSVKALLMSTGVVSIAKAMKFSVPLIMDFGPLVWSSVLLLLKPPYIYAVINGIIIIIAASSRFPRKLYEDDNSNTHSEQSVLSTPLPQHPTPLDYAPVISASQELGVLDSLPVVNENDIVAETQILDVMPVVVNGSEVVVDEDENKLVISKSNWMSPQQIESPETQPVYSFPTREKRLVSSRFGHGKPIRSSPEGGRAPRVAKPKRQDTLESTWKRITDGRHMPLTRHMKKLDTWENHGRQFNLSPPKSVVKSETFKDRTNYEGAPVSYALPRSSANIVREPSLSHDELNRRVEAFINKINEDMRLQRQESLEQYMEMNDRGAH